MVLVLLEQRNCTLHSTASGEEQKSLQLNRAVGGLCLPLGSVLRDPGDVLIFRFQLPLQEDQTLRETSCLDDPLVQEKR